MRPQLNGGTLGGRTLRMLAIVLGTASLIAALTCAVTRRRDLARMARTLGLAVLACGFLALVAGVAMTWSATSAPGLSQADRQRMLSNGVAEFVYNALLTVLVAAPALLVGHWILRKQPPKTPAQ